MMYLPSVSRRNDRTSSIDRTGEGISVTTACEWGRHQVVDQ